MLKRLFSSLSWRPEDMNESSFIARLRSFYHHLSLRLFGAAEMHETQLAYIVGKLTARNYVSLEEICQKLENMKLHLTAVT